MINSILKSPIISEKSLALANRDNTYTFEVARQATKNQIKHAVEDLYEVEVKRVRTIITAPLVKRTGRKRLRRTQSPIKKALVTLSENHKIDLFDLGGQE